MKRTSFSKRITPLLCFMYVLHTCSVFPLASFHPFHHSPFLQFQALAPGSLEADFPCKSTKSVSMYSQHSWRYVNKQEPSLFEHQTHILFSMFQICSTGHHRSVNQMSIFLSLLASIANFRMSMAVQILEQPSFALISVLFSTFDFQQIIFAESRSHPLPQAKFLLQVG